MKIHYAILQQQWRERAGEFAGVPAILMLIALACYFFARPKINMFMATIDVLLSVSLIIIGGFIFWVVFMGRISQLTVFKLYGGYQFLKEAPYTLSRIQGNIAKGFFPEAEAELLPLAELHPGDAQVVNLLTELYTGPMKRPESAITVLERYFMVQNRDNSSPENWKNLMTLADMEQKCGKSEFAIALLHSELRHPGYGKHEKKLMETRLAVLARETHKSGRDKIWI